MSSHLAKGRAAVCHTRKTASTRDEKKERRENEEAEGTFLRINAGRRCCCCSKMRGHSCTLLRYTWMRVDVQSHTMLCDSPILATQARMPILGDATHAEYRETAARCVSGGQNGPENGWKRTAWAYSTHLPLQKATYLERRWFVSASLAHRSLQIASHVVTS